MSHWARSVSEGSSLQPASFGLLFRHSRWVRDFSLGELG
ncbi:hypothetical protein A2U01_0093573, partial [Trifolium medium]|nr:hypothetical protein [Trifolium medium]